MGKVTIIAMSASKIYDGLPFTSLECLFYGLPDEFTAQASTGGSQTNAGTTPNPVYSYSFYNNIGEDVTEHFTNVETVPGTLVIDPEKLVVWTGSAEKPYDGKPLTNPDARVVGYEGYQPDTPFWRNAACALTTAAGESILYCVCGTVLVTGTNPLTGETREILLMTGQSLRVVISDDEDHQSFELQTDSATEDELPADILRLYADRPELLQQACEDADWNSELMRNLIRMLPQGETPAVDLLFNIVNLRISLNPMTASSLRSALGPDEVRFVDASYVPESIVVTATGSQTEIGESLNTCELDWGGEDPGNFILYEDLGTLTVTENGHHFGTPDFILPSATTSIKAHAFTGAAMSVVDASRCTSIGSGAFMNCTSLLKIRLPKDCSIAADAFSGCTALIAIYAPANGSTERWADENGIPFENTDP